MKERRLNDATPAEWDAASRSSRHTQIITRLIEEYRDKAVNSKDSQQLYVYSQVMSELQQVLKELK